MQVVEEQQQLTAVVNPTLGSDPEVFIYASELDMVVPVLDMLGGTKENPKPLPEDGYFVQEDNVLAEFNIPPANSGEKFVAYIGTGLELLREALPSGFSPLIQSSHRFKKTMLSDPRAMVFGCDPDFNAWRGGEQNPPPMIDEDPFLRSSGGHVILGYDNPNEVTNMKIIQLQDALLGIPSVILDRDTDRRKLYGKAGAFRHKPFGVEYRTLSSFWLQNPRLVQWVWDQTMLAIDMVNRGDFSLLEQEAFIVDTINTANVKNAELFVKKYNIAVPN